MTMDKTPPDKAKAAEWYLRAAEQGNAEAQLRIGLAYGNAIGVDRDFSASRHWYEMAARQGNRQALHNLGIIYFNGLGVNANLSRAADYLRNAASLGHPESPSLLRRVEYELRDLDRPCDAFYPPYYYATPFVRHARGERWELGAPAPSRVFAECVRDNFTEEICLKKFGRLLDNWCDGPVLAYCCNMTRPKAGRCCFRCGGRVLIDGSCHFDGEQRDKCVEECIDT